LTAFKEKKIRRVENLKNRIAKKASEAEQIYNSADQMQKCIPWGQPILIGHHSEKGDRRFRARIHQKRGKAFALFDEVKNLERRIESIENNNSILIDDPEAKSKLENKIELLKISVEKSKAYNKILGKLKTYSNALVELEKIVKDSERRDEDKKTALFLLKSLSRQYSFYALPPEKIQAYYFSMTNSGAEIRRLEKRLIEIDLKNNTGLEMSFKFSKVSDDGVYIKIDFDDKPNDEIRGILKSSPLVLKWSSFQGAWIRKKTGQVLTGYFKSALIDVLSKYDLSKEGEQCQND